MAHFRRDSRIAALQALFESDSSGHSPETALSWLSEEQTLSESVFLYAKELIQGVIDNQEYIDSLIHTHAPTWPVEQLSAIDRNILRVAIFEILIENRVPLKAAINEAVELAKIFGSHNSPKFINGVLGTISKAEVNSR
jgi:N utilization substance protein B